MEESFGEKDEKEQIIYVLNCILFASNLMKTKFENGFVDYENIKLDDILGKFENLYIELDEMLNYLNNHGK